MCLKFVKAFHVQIFKFEQRKRVDQMNERKGQLYKLKLPWQQSIMAVTGCKQHLDPSF